MINLISILIGILAGAAGGFFGIGGAIILIPALVYLFKFSQHMAQGTSLAALLLPVGIFAVMKYYKTGNVNIKIAFLISLGFFVGGFIGAYIAQFVPNIALKRFFAGFLLCVALYMLFGK